MAERVEVPTARCKSCDAEIIWASITKKDGTPGQMPFDKDPDEKGYYCLVRRSDGTIHASYIKKGESFPAGGLPRKSHFATCPNAPSHRRAP